MGHAEAPLGCAVCLHRLRCNGNAVQTLNVNPHFDSPLQLMPTVPATFAKSIQTQSANKLPWVFACERWPYQIERHWRIDKTHPPGSAGDTAVAAVASHVGNDVVVGHDGNSYSVQPLVLLQRRRRISCAPSVQRPATATAPRWAAPAYRGTNARCLPTAIPGCGNLQSSLLSITCTL